MSAMDTANLPACAPAGDGGMQNVTNLLTSGTYQDTCGEYCTIYPAGYPALWPEIHHHYGTGVNASSEKPHETVARALKEIAAATRALRESAEAMGVPVKAAALEEAIVERLRAAL